MYSLIHFWLFSGPGTGPIGFVSEIHRFCDIYSGGMYLYGHKSVLGQPFPAYVCWFFGAPSGKSLFMQKSHSRKQLGVFVCSLVSNSKLFKTSRTLAEMHFGWCSNRSCIWKWYKMMRSLIKQRKVQLLYFYGSLAGPPRQTHFCKAHPRHHKIRHIVCCLLSDIWFCLIGIGIRRRWN